MKNLGLRTLLIGALWVVVLGSIVGLHSVKPPDALALSGARWTLTALTPSAAAIPNVSLPHEWREISPELRHARYETTVELAAPPTEPWAIYLSSLSMNAAVFVNGTRIGDGGRMIEPLARHRYRPLLFTVPASALRVGSNSIAMEVRAEPHGSGFLQQVYWAPLAQLQPYFDLRYFLKVQFLVGVMLALSVVGALMLGVWFARRGERAYLWYALTSLGLISYAATFAASAWPLPSLWWDWLRFATIGWMVCAVTVFSFHFLDMPHPRMTRALALISVVAPALLALLAHLSPDVFYLSAQVWDSAVLGFGGFALGLYVKALWRRTDALSFWNLATSTSMVLGGVHDVLLVNHLIAPYDGFFFLYSVPLPIMVFSWNLVSRFLGALTETESLNRTLNQRVLQKETELEHTYQELKHSEQQRTLADERERIQRDMHDGLGGTLVSTLAGLEMEGASQSSAAASLRSALDDLRLMIYSLDQTSGALRAALAMLRERLARLAEDTGLALEWDMQHLPEELALERGVTLQVMRIVQEAFTNTVKHARAKTFSLIAGAGLPSLSRDRDLTIEMRDDGVGFESAAAKSGGYGLSNMRVRAQKIGGRLEIGSAAPGMRITLLLPLPPGEADER